MFYVWMHTYRCRLNDNIIISLFFCRFSNDKATELTSAVRAAISSFALSTVRLATSISLHLHQQEKNK